MEKPIIAQKRAYVVEESPGTKFWCACGRSSNQPYCDGSHKGTGIVPVKVEITEQKKVYWCGCKQSKKEPFCDGTHRDL